MIHQAKKLFIFSSFFNLLFFYTHAQQDKPIFGVGVLGIVDHKATLVRERRLGFFERNSVFASIGPVLAFVPFEPELAHDYIVLTLYVRASRAQPSMRTMAAPLRLRRHNVPGLQLRPPHSAMRRTRPRPRDVRRLSRREAANAPFQSARAAVVSLQARVSPPPRAILIHRRTSDSGRFCRRRSPSRAPRCICELRARVASRRVARFDRSLSSPVSGRALMSVALPQPTSNAAPTTAPVRRTLREDIDSIHLDEHTFRRGCNVNWAYQSRCFLARESSGSRLPIDRPASLSG